MFKKMTCKLTRVYYDILLINSQQMYMQSLSARDARALVFIAGGIWIKIRNFSI